MSSRPETKSIHRGVIVPDPFKGGMVEMRHALEEAQPEKVRETGRVYTQAARKFQAAAEELRAQISALSGVWIGDDAEKTASQLRRLQVTAENLKVVSEKTGKALADYADRLEWYKDPANQPDEGLISGFSKSDLKNMVLGGGFFTAKKAAEGLNLIDSAEDNAAQKYMDQLAEHAAQVSKEIPKQVVVDMPDRVNEEWGPEDEKGPKIPNTGGPGGVTPPKVPNDPFGNGGAPNIPNASKDDPFGGINPPKDPYSSSGSDLAGVPGGPGLGTGSDPFGRGGLGGAGGGLGGGALGGGVGGIGGGLGPAAGLTGGAPGMGRGGPGAGAGRGGLGSGPKGGAGGMAGGGGAPGGRGGGKGEEEHERSTWLVEDEDVWGASDGDAAPPVIG